jgi:hypothetical protein
LSELKMTGCCFVIQQRSERQSMLDQVAKWIPGRGDHARKLRQGGHELQLAGGWAFAM